MMIVNSLSRRGTLHEFYNIVNQDFVHSGENEKFCVITLADGVSSCIHAEKGAEIACKALTDIFLRNGKFFLDSDVSKFNEKLSGMILYNILHAIKKIAPEQDINEYSSTIAGALYDKASNKILCFNVGDGMIIALKEQGYRVLLAPYQNDKGCCVTTTKGAERLAGLKIFETGEINSTIILSDGAWKQIFHDKNFAALKDFEVLDNYLDISKCVDDYSYISITKEGIK